MNNKNTIEKHLYRRTINKNGKKVSAWYFWFYDKSGKQIRKSCGINHQLCTTKREAEEYLATLNDGDLLSEKKDITLYDFAAGMFDPDSLYIKNLKLHGIEFASDTLKGKQYFLNQILQQFGEQKPENLTSGGIEIWLAGLDISNSRRNNILTVFKTIFKELYKHNLIDKIPLLESYKRNDKKEKGILSLQELNYLFPDDYELLLSRWKLCNFETEFEVYQFAVIIYLLATTGMRSGEVRALQNNQFIQEDVILLNAMLRREGDNTYTRLNVLKKGTETNKKWRISILSKRCIEMLQKYRSMKSDNNGPEDFLFMRNGEPFKTDHLNLRFKSVCKRNGIDVAARNITIHSLRFTYNTVMRCEISETDLRSMLGHSTEKMTDYYDKSQVTDKIPELLKNKDIIDSIWK